MRTNKPTEQRFKVTRVDAPETVHLRADGVTRAACLGAQEFATRAAEKGDLWMKRRKLLVDVEGDDIKLRVEVEVYVRVEAVTPSARGVAGP